MGGPEWLVAAPVKTRTPAKLRSVDAALPQDAAAVQSELMRDTLEHSCRVLGERQRCRPEWPIRQPQNNRKPKSWPSGCVINYGAKRPTLGGIALPSKPVR